MNRYFRSETEKPMSHGGIATQKDFARPESFLRIAMKSIIKNMPKLYAILVHKLLQKRINVNVAKTIYYPGVPYKYNLLG